MNTATPPAATDPPDPHGATPLVTARQINLTEERGHIFGPLDLDLSAGGVTMLLAPMGVRRTALLLALCGRMHLSSGSLTVMGHADDPRAVFAESTICCLDEIDEIQPAVSVRNVVTEERRWHSPFFSWVPKADQAALENMCGETFGDVPLPQLDAFVENLPVVQQLLLRISLANAWRPPLLVVGRLDQVTSDQDQSQVLRRLLHLGEKQSVIVGGVNRPPPDWGVKVVDLSDMASVRSYTATSQGANP